MNPKSRFSSPTIAALTIFAAAVLFTSWQAVAQSPPSKTATTWQDLGYNELPEGISTDVIPLFEGLNESRGTWSFEGQAAGGDAATPLKGSAITYYSPSKPSGAMTTYYYDREAGIAYHDTGYW